MTVCMITKKIDSMEPNSFAHRTLGKPDWVQHNQIDYQSQKYHRSFTQCSEVKEYLYLELDF